MKRYVWKNGLPLGKKVMDHIYFHISYKDKLPQDYIIKIDEYIAQIHEYLIITEIKNTDIANANLIKLELVGNDVKSLTLLYSPDFDISDEPILRSFASIKNEEINIHSYDEKTPIYHHKYLMVKENYSGFDVQKSEERGELIAKFIQKNNIPKSSIGWKHKWNEILQHNY